MAGRGLSLAAGAAFLALSVALPADEVVLPSASAALPLESAGVSARAWGLAQGYVSLADGASSLYWNPAGLAALPTADLELDHNAYLLDTSQETVALAWPLPGGVGLGLGMDWVDYGTFTERDSLGNPTGTSSASDMEWRLGLAAPLPWDLSVGLAGQVLDQTLSTYFHQSYAGDIGLEWKPAGAWRAGASLMDLGGASGGGARDWTARAGLARRWAIGPEAALMALAGFSQDSQGLDKYQAALEARLYGRLSLRCGYEWSQDQIQVDGFSGLTAGLGFNLAGFDLDYAFIPLGDLGNSQRVSLDYPFAAAPVQDSVGAFAVASAESLADALLGLSGTAWVLGGNAYVGVAAGGFFGTGYAQGSAQDAFTRAGLSSQLPAETGWVGGFWAGYRFPMGLVLELGTQVNPSRSYAWTDSAGGTFHYSATYNDYFIYSMAGYRVWAGRRSLLTLGLKEGANLLQGSYQASDTVLGVSSGSSGSDSSVGYAFGPVLRWDRLLGDHASLGLEAGYDYDLNTPQPDGAGAGGAGQQVLNYSGVYVHATVAGWFGRPLGPGATASGTPALPPAPLPDLPGSPPPLSPSAEPSDQAPALPPQALRLKFQLPGSPLAEAEALQSQGRTKDALDLFLKILHGDAANLAAWRDLADLYTGLGRRDYAAQCFEQILRLQPGDPKAQQWLDAYKAQP